LLVS
jgi:hypothetical protein